MSMVSRGGTLRADEGGSGVRATDEHPFGSRAEFVSRSAADGWENATIARGSSHGLVNVRGRANRPAQLMVSGYARRIRSSAPAAFLESRKVPIFGGPI